MKLFLFTVISSTSLFALNYLSLSKAYELSLNYESNIRSLGYQKEAKKEEINQTKSYLYPQVNASVSKTDRRYKTNNTKRYLDEDYDKYSITASQIIYNAEAMAKVVSSKSRSNYSSLNYESAKQKLAFDVTDSYISVLKAQNSISVALAFKDATFTKYQQIKKKFDLGLSNEMDLLESRIIFEQAEIDLVKEENLLELHKLKLMNLTGIDVNTVKIPNVDFDKIDITLLRIDQNILENNNFEIAKAKETIQLSNNEINIAKYGHFPTVSLSANYDKYKNDNITGDYDNDRRIMLELRVPIFQGGLTNSRIEQNQLLARSSNEDLDNAKRMSYLELQEAKLNYDLAVKNIKLYKDSEKSARLYLLSVNKGYDKGLKSLIELEDGKTKLIENQFKVIESVYSLIQSYAKIANVMGNLDDSYILNIENTLSSKQ